MAIQLVFVVLALLVVLIVIAGALVRWGMLSDSLQPGGSQNSSFNLYTGWESYRIGDMIRLRSRKENRTVALRLHAKDFPQSIVMEYLKKTELDDDMNTLHRIVSDRGKKSDKQAGKNTLVVHLRVGDVFERNPDPVEDILDGKCPVNIGEDGQKHYCHFVLPLHYYTRAAADLKRNFPDISSVVLVGGSHHKLESYPKSTVYIKRVQREFQKYGFKVRLRLAKNPDEDLIFMGNAKYLLPSGGGYSILVVEVAKRNGATILGAGYDKKKVYGR